MVSTQVLEDALLRLADDVVTNEVDAGSHYRVARELLHWRSPRLKSGTFEQTPSEDAISFALRIVTQLDHAALAIQGPPAGFSSENRADSIDGRISVAPMMDWTD